jgi:large subunit ribosomal protein L21
MYAIVETGGKQYRVKPGDTIAVERIDGEPGEVLDLGRVLLVAGNGQGTRIGSPGVEGAVVRAEVVEHARGEKIIVFRYKSKVRYRRKTGHRQALTRLRITDILLNGKSTAGTSEASRSATAERTAATAEPTLTTAEPTSATVEQAPASAEPTPTTAEPTSASAEPRPTSAKATPTSAEQAPASAESAPAAEAGPPSEEAAAPPTNKEEPEGTEA